VILQFRSVKKHRRAWWTRARPRQPGSKAEVFAQSLLDLPCHPSVLYFNRAEITTFAEASEYAERHRTAAERLNDLEKRNRTEGEALDDVSIGRISSFLKSYGEMRKGEQFVMDEVRARARERVRWGASLCLLALALLFAPIAWRRPRVRAPR
jgi:hypothetical protein